MRCFIAIPIPDDIKQGLARLSAQLRQCPVSAAWAQPERAHLTLRFFGEITDEDVDAIDAYLRKALAGVKPFTLHVRGTGAFPSMRRPSIVWAGVEPADGPLATVQRECDAAAKAIGLPREEKTFHPHITIARVKGRRPPAILTPAIEKEREFDAGQFSVTSVSLFRSELTRRGPEYARLREYEFS